MNQKQLFKEINQIYERMLKECRTRFKIQLKNLEFKAQIEEYKKLDNVTTQKEEKKWIKDFCNKSAYLMLIKLLFLQSCQKEEIIKEKDLEDNSLLQNCNRLFKKFTTNIEFDDRWSLLTPSKEELIVARKRLEKYDFIISKENLLGEIYQYLMSQDSRRKLGQYYTSADIIDYILEKTVAKVDILEDPYLKILDPACGSGYFLIRAYDILLEKYIVALEDLKELYPNQEWDKNMLHQHILTYNLYGVDIDSFALQLTVINLLFKDITTSIVDLNIRQGDTLKLDFEEEFDIIIGNPPYIGHKELTKEYKVWLKERYDVYADKADISCCFLEKGLNLLKPRGELMVITTRYFLESPTGKELRNYLQTKADIQHIFDFYGLQLFKSAVVDPIILKLKPKSKRENKIEVVRLNNKAQNFSGDIVINQVLTAKEKSYYQHYTVLQDDLDVAGWRLLSQEELDICKKIEEKADYSLQELCISSQGIITGYDKAFIVTNKEVEDYQLESSLLKPWLKNSHIKQFQVQTGDNYLIYSNLIGDTNQFSKTINYLKQFKDRLISRRECKKGVIDWYNLQWGREQSLFEQKKIIYPYKAPNNRFAIDQVGNYCSADIYLLLLNEKFKSRLTLEFLIGLLNSKLYQFYFKSFAKKMSYKIYDYYPNTVLRLKIKLDSQKKIERLVDKITKLNDRLKKISFIPYLQEENYNNLEELYQIYVDFVQKKLQLESKLKDTKNRLNYLVYDIYDLDKQQVRLISDKLRVGRYGLLEEEYLNNYCYFNYNQIIENRYKLAEKLKTTLTEEEFTQLHHHQEKSLREIAIQVGCEYQTLVILQQIYSYSSNKGWNCYNFKELREAIGDYLAHQVEETLKQAGSYLTLNQLYQELKEQELKIDTLLQILRKDNNKLALKDIIFARKYTWNQYQKRRKKNLKMNFKFINYEKYNFGLSYWTKDKHKVYFEDKYNEFKSINSKLATKYLKLVQSLN